MNKERFVEQKARQQRRKSIVLFCILIRLSVLFFEIWAVKIASNPVESMGIGASTLLWILVGVEVFALVALVAILVTILKKRM